MPEPRDIIIEKLQRKLNLATRREAEFLLTQTIQAIESTLLEHLDTDGFKLKLYGFGIFTVHHVPAHQRKVGYSGETVTTKPKRKTLELLTYRARAAVILGVR